MLQHSATQITEQHVLILPVVKIPLIIAWFFYSYSTTNKMHLLSQIIYSCKTLYMFQTVFLFIIRSSKLLIQQRCMSNSCCYLLVSGMRWNGVIKIIYSCKTLYMFQTVFPSIIRSSKLRIQQRYMSNSCCYLLLLGMRWNGVIKIIYSCKTLYMFQAVFPSISRSSKLRIQQRYMSNSCCYLLLLGMRWNSAVWHMSLLYKQFWTPDDGRKDRPKHVERFTRINNFR